MIPTMEVKKQQFSTINKKNKKKFFLIVVILILISLVYLNYLFFTSEICQKTNDAYVAGEKVQIMSQISGNVEQVLFENMNLVKKGDILVSLDKTNAKQNLKKAQNKLVLSAYTINDLIIKNKKNHILIKLYQLLLNNSVTNLKNIETFKKTSDLDFQRKLQKARNAVIRAQINLEKVKQQEANITSINSNNIESNPILQERGIALQNAWIKLQRTNIRSPIDGYVSHINVQIGSQVSPSIILMNIVPINNLWIEANFKETQLSSIRIGQPAIITSDIYGKKVQYHGKVISLDVGTGSSFSILPAQNATGNWIKVIQRLPVRISIDPKEEAEHPLRLGLSTQVKIDTTNKKGNILIKSDDIKKINYNNKLLHIDLTPVNRLFSCIIHDIIK